MPELHPKRRIWRTNLDGYRSNDKRRGRLNIISHLLSQIPYEAVKREKIELPKRQKKSRYKEKPFARHWVPEAF
jgi:hypothetical protein